MAAAAHPTPDTGVAPAPMTHKEILEALSGLLIAMFVAMLSSTVVTNALPRIISDLHGSQTGYTWVVVATMLAMTATTPIWGKLADQFDKKRLMQTALIIFVIGSVAAGLAQSMTWLIGARVVTGLGVGGMISLIQTIIATMVAPRERGRYAGYIGVSFGLATVSGPLIGGLVVDSFIGWRGCFFIGLPFAVIAFFVLQAKLHLPVVKRKVKIDYLGSFLLMSGISLLLIWVSLAGQHFDWVSATSAYMVVGALLILAAAVYVEARVAVEPVIPLHLFADRTISLGVLASVFVGVAMFGSTVFLGQYFQYSRGMSPTEAGLMSLCMVLGLMVTGMVSGQVITRTGYWKKWLVGGMGVAVVGSALLSRIDDTTPLWLVGLFMLVMGAGLGATQQNLLLAVQNNVEPHNIGSASAVVNFFRSVGGSAGVSALGAALNHEVGDHVTSGVERLIATNQLDPAQAAAMDTGALPDIRTLHEPLLGVFESAFGNATGHIFLVTTPFILLAFVCVTLIKEVPLRSSAVTEPAPAPVEREATA